MSYRPAALLAVALALAGCAATAQPRFSADISTALADYSMRRLDTESLTVYYPAGRRAVAERTAARIATCQQQALERARLRSWSTRESPVFIMPELPFNNAFVMPRFAGYEQIAVVPTENTLDFTTAFGLPPDPAWIGCHEVIHYVHEQQFAGFWGTVNKLFGNVLSPQNGLDAWFWEGLATYYEDGRNGGAGRLHWPVWRGMFAAAYAGGGVDGDDFSELRRDAPPGHHYLVGSHFIEWLVATYGEQRLWELIARQGKSFAFLIGHNSRFDRVYGRSLSSLIGEFDAHLRDHLPRRLTPPTQRRLRELGTDARYARAPDGTEAFVVEGVDTPTRLEVRGPDGRVRYSDNLVDLMVPRKLVLAAPILVSGMSFTADSKQLWLTVVDQGPTYQQTRLLQLEVAGGDLDVVATDLGPGGAIAPDGSRYYVAEVDGDAWGLAEYDLATRKKRVLVTPRPGHFILRVAPSPDGRRLAVSEWDGDRFDIVIYEREGDALRRRDVIAGAHGAPAYDASFVDDGRVIYLAEVDGRFQVWLHDLASGARRAVSDAAYTAFEPRAAAGTVRFLDRQGWRWDLAEIELPGDALVVETLPVSPSAPPGATAAAPAAVVVKRDRAYSPFDGLFKPSLHTIALAQPSLGVTLLGVGLAGGDRLSLQRWALNGYVNVTPKPYLFSAAGGYSTTLLAPWIFIVSGSNLRWHEPIDEDDEPGAERYADRTTVDVVASLGRTYRASTGVSLDLVYTSDDFRDLDPARRRLGGAGLSLFHDNLEATAYGGIRRRFAFNLQGTHFPDSLSTLDTHLFDGRVEMLITAPVPWTRRHSLSLALRHRNLYQPDPVPGFAPLEVGGAGVFAPIYQRRNKEVDAPTYNDDFVPERLRFVEPLRGYEDWTLSARWAAIAEAAWSYPIILDEGWATTLWFMPAVLLRELDLELWGSAAVVEPAEEEIGMPGAAEDTHHLVAGAAVTASIYLWRIPLLLQYQVGRRFTDDEAITQQFGVGLGL